MPFMSPAQVGRLESHVARQETTIANLKKRGKAEQAAGVALQVLEGAGAAGIVGFIRGTVEKSGKPFALGPVDMELAIGGGLVLAAGFKLFGKYDEHVLNMGVGVLSHYAGQMGRAMGKGQPLTPVIGMLPDHVGMNPTFVGRGQIGQGGYASSDLAAALAASAAV